MTLPRVGYPLLEAIDARADFRRPPTPKLTELAGGLRPFLIHSTQVGRGLLAPDGDLLPLVKARVERWWVLHASDQVRSVRSA